MNVNVWQDVSVSEFTGASGAGQGRPPASNVEVLKALADPLRMNMLYVLTRNTGEGPPVMTVKELAAELGEPQTKLYRHVKHLEAVGLIAAVSSRVVSGIVEQRYQIVSANLTGDELTVQERTSPEAEAMVAAAMEIFRRQYFAAVRSGHQENGDSAGHRRSHLVMTDGRVTPARADAIREQLRALADELSAPPDPDADDLIPLNLLVGYFSPDDTAS